NVALTRCNVACVGGHLYIADTAPRPRSHQTGAVREMSPGSSTLTTLAGSHLFSGPIGDGRPATKAPFTTCGVTADQAGNLVISDYRPKLVRIVAASDGTFYGIAMKAADIYTVAGNGKQGFAGDAGPATSAQLDDPQGVKVDRSGNLVVSDASNERVRVVAESTGTFYGMAMTAGDIYTVAGDGGRGFSGDVGPAASAMLNYPSRVAVDAVGNLVIGDQGNCRVRVVAESTGTFYGMAMTAGDIYTVAGDGNCSYSGSGVPATSAGMSPSGVVVDGAGNVVVADGQNNRIRVIAESTGTFYGIAMTAGDIYTVAGTGTAGHSGDRVDV